MRNLTVRTNVINNIADLAAAKAAARSAAPKSVEERKDAIRNLATKNPFAAGFIPTETETKTDLTLSIQHDHSIIVKTPEFIIATIEAELGLIPSTSSNLFSTSIEKMIVHNVIDLNVQTKQGQNALHLAIISGKKEVADFLLKYNLKLDMDNHQDYNLLKNIMLSNNFVLFQNVLKYTKNIDSIKHDDKSLLHEACVQGKLKAVKILHHYGANINLPNLNKYCPIHFAVVSDTMVHLKVINYLAKHGANLNVQSLDDDATPLYIACQYKFYKTIKLLLLKGANPNLPVYGPVYTSAVTENDLKLLDILLNRAAEFHFFYKGATPLHVACEQGHYEIAKRLIAFYKKANLDLNQKAPLDWTPLLMAAYHNHPDIVKLLLENGAQPDPVTSDNGMTPLMYACIKGHKEVVKYFIQFNADLNIQNFKVGIHSLYCAVEKNHIEIVEMLLKAGADPYLPLHNSHLPIFYPCQQGNTPMIKKLLLSQIDFHVDQFDTENYQADKTIVSFLYKTVPILPPQAFIHLAKTFLALDLDAKLMGQIKIVLLRYACLLNNIELIDFMIKEGAQVNSPLPFNSSPLFKDDVYFFQEEKVLRILIEAGVDVNETYGCPINPLQFSIMQKQFRITTLLVNAGANVNLDKNKISHASAPLILVAKNSDNYRIIKMLLEKGADINVVDEDGRTALHHACQNGFLYVAHALIQNGIELGRLDNYGKIALEYAEDNVNMDELSNLLSLAFYPE